MKEDIKKQQETKRQQELSNDELLNVTGGTKTGGNANNICNKLNEAECVSTNICEWVTTKFGHSHCQSPIEIKGGTVCSNDETE